MYKHEKIPQGAGACTAGAGTGAALKLALKSAAGTAGGALKRGAGWIVTALAAWKPSAGWCGGFEPAGTWAAAEWK